MRRIFAAFFFCLICEVTHTQDTIAPPKQKFPDNWVVDAMESKILGEKRPFAVVLPESYKRNNTQRYPVVYVLDGGQVKHTSLIAAAMARDSVIPEVIAVGIPNTSNPNPERDLTPPFLRRDIDNPDSPLGAGDKFLEFLKTELIPRIERDYRTTPFRTLVGNSRGGLLVFYSLIVDPQLFHAWFAFSTPVWRAEAVTVTKLNDALMSLSVDSSAFFIWQSVARRARILSLGIGKPLPFWSNTHPNG